jgi:uncharacterized BrkB/YihY/UPF0761 family membrane protein
METPKNIIEDLWDKTEEYGKTSFELTKLKVLESGILITGLLVAKVGVILAASVCILVLNLGIAFYLGKLFGEIYLGFFIVAIFYLVATIILYFYLHSWIKQSISTIIIKEALH